MSARCLLAARCPGSKAGCGLNRYPGHHLLERARRQSHGPAARRDRAHRQWFQERNFAEATTQHGFKRARWRGLATQTIQDQLIATLQNLKILLRRGGSGHFVLRELLQRCSMALKVIQTDFQLFVKVNLRLTFFSTKCSNVRLQMPLSGNSPFRRDPERPTVDKHKPHQRSATYSWRLWHA
ncbi:MAG: transposase [Chthoniobacterales bacterium]